LVTSTAAAAAGADAAAEVALAQKLLTWIPAAVAVDMMKGIRVKSTMAGAACQAGGVNAAAAA
jgi:hypothetical protein